VRDFTDVHDVLPPISLCSQAFANVDGSIETDPAQQRSVKQWRIVADAR
jgi:hypothetical protein